MRNIRGFATAVVLAALAATLVACGTATGIAAVVAGEQFSCARLDDGRVACWGTNARGQTAAGAPAGSNVPVIVPGLVDATEITAGQSHACALDDVGTVRCWGANDDGQVGDGTTTDALQPVAVSALSSAVAVAGGGAHTCALTDDGSVACWGANDRGQLGVSGPSSSAVPLVVAGLAGVTSIAAGAEHSCALLGDGSARCWGANDRGQLGDGTTTDSSTPVTVDGLTGATDLDTGTSHSCGLASGGTVTCWGANDRGQLGDGTTTDDPTPQPVPGLASVEALGLGLSHSCAATGGTLRCWGANSDSQVADVPGDVLAPVVVAGITDVTDVDGGADHTCARTDPDGKVLCWGSHAAGQLGRGTAPGGPTPSLVSAVTQAPSIVGALPARLVNGTTIDPVVLQGTGSGTVTVAHTGGSLPPGLAFDASVPGRLTVTGTPTVDGSYSFTLTATNGTAPDAVRTFDVEVGTAPVIESSLPPTMPVRSPVDLQLTASGSGPMTWSVVAGSDPLPAGLTLDAGGRLSGAPTAVGTATGTIEVSSDFGTDTLPFAIEVTYPIVTTIVGPGPDAGPATDVGSPSSAGTAGGGIALRGSELFVSNPEVPTVRRVDLTTGQQQRVAGDYIRRVTPLPAPALQSSFNTPHGSAIGPDGALYFVTAGDHRVLRLGDDGTLSLFASITTPIDITFDPSGNAYIYAIPGRIWKVPSGGGTPQLIAGNGTCSHTGNGGPATAATVCPNYRLATGPDGSLYFDGGSDHNVIRRIAPDGTISALPGVAPGPMTAITASTGTIFVAHGNMVFRYDAGTFVKVAGTAGYSFGGDGGPALSANFGQITDLEVGDDGALYVLDGNDNYRVRRVVIGGTVTTVAGNGFKHSGGDGGPATAAQILEADGATYDSSGNLYFSDRQSRVVRKVSPGGVITTVAGTGENCSVPSTCLLGDGQPATASPFSTPVGIALDADDNVYVADQVGLVWKITTDGIMHRFAGGGSGTGTFAGDGGPATAARFSNPTDVAISPTGEIHVADYGNNRVRKVDAAGIVTTVAGSGPDGFGGTFAGDGGPATNAKLNGPRSLAFDTVGNLYIGDLVNNRVRKVTPTGTITTVAGSASNSGGDGGPATGAGLNRPYDVAITATGELLIADFNNRRIRRVDGGGVITTVAGTGAGDYSGDGGLATDARMHGAVCLAIDGDGAVAFCDTLSWRVRQISPL